MKPTDIAQALEALPKLKASIERILSVAQNSDKSIELADDAEAVLLAESPEMNQAALQAWANSQAKEKSEAFANRHKSARKDVKKN